jgi:hypothetical protein
MDAGGGDHKDTGGGIHKTVPDFDPSMIVEGGGGVVDAVGIPGKVVTIWPPGVKTREGSGNVTGTVKTMDFDPLISVGGDGVGIAGGWLVVGVTVSIPGVIVVPPENDFDPLRSMVCDEVPSGAGCGELVGSATLISGSAASGGFSEALNWASQDKAVSR